MSRLLVYTDASKQARVTMEYFWRERNMPKIRTAVGFTSLTIYSGERGCWPWFGVIK
jgi:hypothetical protein